jgi:hypothetical protein
VGAYAAYGTEGLGFESLRARLTKLLQCAGFLIVARAQASWSWPTSDPKALRVNPWAARAGIVAGVGIRIALLLRPAPTLPASPLVDRRGGARRRLSDGRARLLTLTDVGAPETMDPCFQKRWQAVSSL